ncbi:hypothetical protein [Halomonas sp. HG01]|uniref:hypothetical protein n=1 Tax=Halomonas sp. HG01 TaxID=1609967 RepID=UPI00061466AD|nr:hypothetical protein [Halomonas sp. HG01]
MRVRCPHCDEGLKTQPDKLDPAPLDGPMPVLAQCPNPFCGWGGKLGVQVTRTTKPSRSAAATETATP